MKKKVLLTICTLLVSIVICSCSSNEEVVKPTNNYAEQISDQARSNFVSSIDIINQKFQSPKTRALTMKDVSDFSEWALCGIVADGLGGGVGGLLGSAIASTAYAKYLNSVKQKMNTTRGLSDDASLKYINVYNDSLYKDVEPKISFVFCDGNPQNALDSIGIQHNQLLNEIEMNAADYTTTYGDIDYVKLVQESKRIASEIGLEGVTDNNIVNEDFLAFCDNTVKALASIPSNSENNDQAFDKITNSLKESAKMNTNDAQFLAILAKLLVGPMVFDIDRENIYSYSMSLNDALKNSQLSEKDINYAKALFQVAVCSSLYWNTQIENNNLKSVRRN